MAAAAPAHGERWRRFHPATPLVRSWVAVLVGLGIVTDGFVGGFGGQVGPFGGPGGSGADDGGFDIGLPFQLLGVLVIALVALIGNVIGWWMTAYRIHDGAVQLRSGVLSRSFRQAPLDRVQAVDVVQPIVGRLFGLVELRIEVAGGSESDVRLAYLPEARAQALRNALLAEAAGMSVTEGEDAPEAPETPILAVPVDRLVASILLTAGVPILVALVALVALTAADIPLVAVAGAFPALVGLGGYLFSRFARGFNFRLATSEDGIRVRGGLTETRAATIPPGRVQALEFSQPLTWRLRDWWRVQVNVAGYGAGEDSQQRSVLLPVGTRLDALWVLRLVIDDIGTDRPLEVLDAGFTGLGTDGGYVHSPRRARWLDPLAWRRNGYAVTATAVLVRSGRLQRRLVVVPHERTQSVGLTQGPVERWAGLVDVGLHSTPGPVSPVVPHLAPAEAARFVAEQTVRARDARARDRTERWMRPPADPGAAAPRPSARSLVGRERAAAARSRHGRAPAARPGRLGVGVVGAGRVGTVLGAALGGAGHAVVGASAVSDASIDRLDALLPGVPRLDPVEVARRAELVLLAVPDDALADLVAGLAAVGSWQPGQLVVHTSGRHGTAVLAPATAAGAIGLAVHPAMTFTGTSLDLARLGGAVMAVTAAPTVLPIAQALVLEMGAEPVVVPEEARETYHAALAHVAGHLVTLVAQGLDVLAAAGVEHPARVLGPLAGAALDNALRLGDGALTGPVARGDVDTVAAHLRVLDASGVRGAAAAYRSLASATVERAAVAGSLPADPARRLHDLLSGQGR